MKIPYLYILLLNLLLALGACKKTVTSGVGKPIISNITVGDPAYHFIQSAFYNLGTDISFTATASPNTKTYTWNFNDGYPDTTTLAPTITYTFLTSGKRKVSLKVANNNGDTSSIKTTDINVDVYSGLVIDSIDFYATKNNADQTSSTYYYMKEITTDSIISGSGKYVNDPNNEVVNNGQGNGGWSFNNRNSFGFPISIDQKILSFNLSYPPELDTYKRMRYITTQDRIMQLIYGEASAVNTLINTKSLALYIPLSTISDAFADMKLYLSLKKYN